jgi:L-rhamnose mutarotase
MLFSAFNPVYGLYNICDMPKTCKYVLWQNDMKRWWKKMKTEIHAMKTKDV